MLSLPLGAQETKSHVACRECLPHRMQPLSAVPSPPHTCLLNFTSGTEHQWDITEQREDLSTLAIPGHNLTANFQMADAPSVAVSWDGSHPCQLVQNASPKTPTGQWPRTREEMKTCWLLGNPGASWEDVWRPRPRSSGSLVMSYILLQNCSSEVTLEKQCETLCSY